MLNLVSLIGQKFMKDILKDINKLNYNQRPLHMMLKYKILEAKLSMFQ